MFVLHQTTSIIYQHHENGVHEFTLLTPTRDTIAEFLIKYVSIAPQDGDDVRALVDISQWTMMPPLSTISQLVREYESRFAQHDYMRTAIIHNGGVFVKLLETFVYMLPRVRNGWRDVRFFHRGNSDQAAAWVLMEK